MSGGTTFYLVRHAESAPDFDIDEALWPLSRTGHMQAEQLAETLSGLPITRIVSSPYTRAIATVEPYARRIRSEIHVEHDLRERNLTHGRRHSEWQALLQRSWTDFDFAEPGAESSRECQQRVHACLTRLAFERPSETFVIASHGNAIALMLTAIDPSFGHAGWRAMRNPDGFRLVHDGRAWHWDRTYRLASQSN